MPSPIRLFLPLLLACSLTPVGCNRQDTECLSQIGRKVVAHAKCSAGDVGVQCDLGWLAVKKEPTLRDKVHDRLRFENTLVGIAFDVTVKDKEVTLKGTVANALQRLRAIELAETVEGVERVTDAITVQDADDMAR